MIRNRNAARVESPQDESSQQDKGKEITGDERVGKEAEKLTVGLLEHRKTIR